MTRPIANPPQKDPSIAPFASIDQVTTDYLQPQRRAIARDDPSRWSSSQLSELRPREAEDIDSVISEAQPEWTTSPRPRQRAYSISTVSEKKSVSGAGKCGELRIVIDRSEDRPSSVGEKSPDTALEVPIPHYRLGSPRFNQEGSATLQSSVYTRASTSDNFRNSTLLGGMVDPMPSRLPSPYSRDSYSRNRASFAVSMFSGAAAAIDLSRASTVPRNSIVYELKGPVEPSIYETLVSDMDGEAVVRYIPGTKDISAATPARIVAQISSESFMDYELVSDFFLTFRSYLSTTHLLALLLARLQWAINRPQDDGRIIRIRTFAALRHWILNYFVDDFVTSYDLRQNFCETINTMYQEVKSRQNGGMSDLKILMDLKRCWNGKCSVYWTDSNFSQAYNDTDSPVMPGTAEVELPANIDIPQQTIPLPASAPAPVPITPAEINSKESLPITHHDRNDSAGTAQSIPVSSKSEQSIMALSCSLPPKSPRRKSGSYAKGKAPRPVLFGLSKSVSPHERPPTSPMMARHPFPGHGHKRSGSFSDSVRDDRHPMFGMESSPIESTPQEALNPVGLIRGVLYPPAESYMAMLAPESPPLVQSSSSAVPDRRSIPENGIKPAHSGVKTIIGSIRRAFHTRNGGHSVSARIAHASESLSMSSRGRTSAMPNHIALGSELYREKKLAAMPRRQARIDVLCDQALQQYRQVLNNHEPTKEIQLQPSAPAVQISPDDATQNNDDAKIKSEITVGSGSIVIVDDTGNEAPAMTGAVQKPAPLAPNRFYTNGPRVVSSVYSGQRYSEQLVPPCYNNEDNDQSPAPAPYQHQPLYPSSSSTRRSFSNERQQTPRKKTSLSLRLRKYASFQSGISKYRSSMGSDAGKSYLSSSVGHDSTDHYQDHGPALRRRPGGNLRQVQHVDELEPEPNRGTFFSHRSYDDSLAETTTSATDVASRPPTRLIPPNPHPQGDEAQNQKNPRRSFESAIARFARIPDEDDGGIDVTLLKLEGKWPSSPPPDQEHFPIGSGNADAEGNPRWDAVSRRPQTDRSSYSYSTGAYSTAGGGGRLMPHRPYSDSVAESEESYNSIPLLERGLADESMKRPATGRAQIGAPLSLISSRDTSELASSHPSIQVIDETESLRRIPPGSTVPQSDLLGAGQATPTHLSVPNSETSVDVIGRGEGRLSVDSRSLSSSTVDIPPHPLAHPPSPPMTIQHPNSFTARRTSPLDKVFVQPQTLTPDTSPRRQGGPNLPIRTEFSANVLQNSEKGHIERDFATDHRPDHVPFILACESQVLAQQLTLVEMAALSEVDWRDLVEMKWSNASQTIRSWVQFLYAEDRKGIDLVVGRFNLMVKWVVSEIILTNDLHERARTIVKFIHTAAHARRISNYATMLQIAIALSSSDCSRLHCTWELVPAEDKRLFKDMECLIQPVRNFHDLRVEMETANLQEGCIPFIGKSFHALQPSVPLLIYVPQVFMSTI